MLWKDFLIFMKGKLFIKFFLYSSKSSSLQQLSSFLDHFRLEFKICHNLAAQKLFLQNVYYYLISYYLKKLAWWEKGTKKWAHTLLFLQFLFWQYDTETWTLFKPCAASCSIRGGHLAVVPSDWNSSFCRRCMKTKLSWRQFKIKYPIAKNHFFFFHMSQKD